MAKIASILGLPENWERLLFVIHYKLSALDGRWDEILRVTLPIPCPLPAREGQDDARVHLRLNV